MSHPEYQLRLNSEAPFPGLSYYEENECHFFFGREEEKDELFRRVRRAPLTVLFGQSGLGKTSLIQAGLFPLLREASYLPIPIRIGFGTEAPALEQQFYLALTSASAFANAECEALQAGESLWEYFHRAHIWSARNRLLVPVLVFDQFEEIFTLGRNEPRIAGWLQALADLIENRIPQSVRLRIETGWEAPDYAYDNLEIKVLLALREDFLPDLEDLRALIPSLTTNRMRLVSLDGERALEVVHRPAPELISPEVAEEVVRFVAGGEKQDARNAELSQLQVEPSLLNLVCQQLNRRRIAEGIPAITTALLRGNKNRLLADFYADCLHGLPSSLAVFVEEQLITPSGFRRAETQENALNMPGMDQVSLMTLVDRRLLRREERFGIPHLELIHDVLTATVLESRDRRRAKAKKEAERRREAELRKQLQRSRRHTLVSVALVIFLLSGITFTYFGLFKEHYSYAKNFTKIHGVASPVDEFAFPYSEIAHRNMTYRFIRKGWFGNMLKMEAIGANSQLVEGGIGTYFSDFNSYQTPPGKVASVEFVYDDVKNRVVSEIARDRFGRMVWGFLYVPLDDDNNQTATLAKAMFLGPDGYPQPQRKSRAEFIEITYNEQGHEVRFRYTDREGNPAPGPDNAYGRAMEYDKCGRLLKLISLNSQGQAMNDLAGNAGVINVYRDGNLIEWRAFDADQEPTLVQDGYYGAQAVYDEWGMPIGVRYFGLRQEPLVDTRTGAYLMVIDHDSGDATSIKLYGPANEPVIAAGANFDFPAHEQRNIFDQQNRLLQSAYFDADGKQLTGSEGWHSVRYEYDESSFRMAASYFDALDKPVNQKTSGIHRWEYVNNDFGMPIEERFFDSEHKPAILRENGYHLRKNQYNKTGKLTEQAYFSVYGKPVVDQVNGAHRIFQHLDRFGNPELIEYFDEKNQPTNNKQGFHRVVATYDEFGSKRSERYYDKNRQPSKGLEGVHQVKYSYNKLGLKTHIAFFDEKEQLVVNRAGIHEALYEYNEKGQNTRYQAFGLNKKPVEDTDGSHLVLHSYDKRGRETKTTKLRANYSPNLDRELGIATMTVVWDKENRPTHIAYYDENDRLVMGPEGYAEGNFNYKSDGSFMPTLHDIDGKLKFNPLWGWAKREVDARGNTTAYYDAEGKLVNGPEGYAEVHRNWQDENTLLNEAFFGPDGVPVAGPGGYHRLENIPGTPSDKPRYFDVMNREINLGPDTLVPMIYISQITNIKQPAAQIGLQAGDILWSYGNWFFPKIRTAELIKGTPFNEIIKACGQAFLIERDRLSSESTDMIVIRNGKPVKVTIPPLPNKNLGFRMKDRNVPIGLFNSWQAKYK